VLVGERGAVPDRDDVAGTDEDVGFTEADLALNALGGAQDYEERVAVLLELRPLMRGVRVLDGQVVEVELLLHLAQQLLVGLVDPDPDELTRELEDLADVLDVDLAEPLAVAGIRDAVDEPFHRELLHTTSPDVRLDLRRSAPPTDPTRERDQRS